METAYQQSNCPNRTVEGFSSVEPSIKEIRFPRGKIEIRLVDGRIIIAPISQFPSINELTPAQRRRYTISGGIAVDFDDSPEVFHIADFLGLNNSQGF